MIIQCIINDDNECVMISDKDYICVQSMDGMLSFYEQDSFAFARFIPQFLIPGPLCYVTSTDTFVTSSSSNYVEAYRYQTLAVSTESENKEQVKTGAGKRLRVDWKTNIGDNVLDIQEYSHSEDNTTTIFVLGEHNLFALRENGVIRFMKKYDFNPSCFAPYASLTEGTVNMLVANHSKTCYVWQDTTLVWSSTLQHIPVFVGVLSKGLVCRSFDLPGYTFCCQSNHKMFVYCGKSANSHVTYVSRDDYKNVSLINVITDFTNF